MFISAPDALIFLRYFAGLSILGFAERAPDKPPACLTFAEDNYAHSYQRRTKLGDVISLAGARGVFRHPVRKRRGAAHHLSDEKRRIAVCGRPGQGIA